MKQIAPEPGSVSAEHFISKTEASKELGYADPRHFRSLLKALALANPARFGRFISKTSETGGLDSTQKISQFDLEELRFFRFECLQKTAPQNLGKAVQLYRKQRSNYEA